MFATILRRAGWWLFPGAPVVLALFCASVFAHAEVVHEVEIRDYRFVPAEVQIRRGERVRWTNREKRTSHSILFPAEGGLESDRLFPDESWQRSFEQRGRHDYQCGPHPEMKGVIVVTE
jgi:plastocyanin